MELDFGAMLSGMNLLLGVCVFILSALIKRLLLKFWESGIGNRLFPLVPMVIGVGLAMAGLCEESITRWQEKLAIGLIASFAASYVFKFGQTTLLGWDQKGQELKAAKRASKTPEPKPEEKPADPKPEEKPAEEKK